MKSETIKQASHSPLPWSAVGTGILQGDKNDPQVVATTETDDIMNVEDAEECEANAAFIVRACNGYEQTVELLNANVQKVYELTAERDELKAHAQRLADALARVIDPNWTRKDVRHAREALAQWEGSK